MLVLQDPFGGFFDNVYGMLYKLELTKFIIKMSLELFSENIN